MARGINNIILVPSLRIALLLVPKCACTSVRQSLVESRHQIILRPDGIPAGYRRIAVVRNTWDRIVSCWLDKTHSPERSVYLGSNSFQAGMTLKNFVMVVARNPRANCHFYPQDEIVEGYDEVWILPELNRQWPSIFPRIQIRHDNANADRHANYRRYYSDGTAEMVGEIYASEIERWEFAW